MGGLHCGLSGHVRLCASEPVPEGEAKSTAQDTLGELDQLLTELTDIAGQQDVERFDRGVAMALDATSRLRVLQAPGLPFDLPRRYDALPRLTAWGFLLHFITSVIHLFIVLYGHHATSVQPNVKIKKPPPRSFLLYLGWRALSRLFVGGRTDGRNE